MLLLCSNSITNILDDYIFLSIGLFKIKQILHFVSFRSTTNIYFLFLNLYVSVRKSNTTRCIIIYRKKTISTEKKEEERNDTICNETRIKFRFFSLQICVELFQLFLNITTTNNNMTSAHTKKTPSLA